MSNALPALAISADSHISEVEDCFADIDPVFEDRRPKAVFDTDRGAILAIEDLGIKVPMGIICTAGRNPEDFGKPVDWHELHPAGHDPAARLAIQDEEGVKAEVLYPSLGMVLCNHPDADYKTACFHAYNRWLADYCSHAPQRLFGAGQAAVKNAAEGADELRAIADQGFKAVMMSGMPGEADYDDAQYDKLWATAQELGLPLCFHILTNPAYSGHRGPKINALLNVVRSCQDIIGLMIYSGVFDRFPDLKVVCVEADAGWAPHYAYRMDHIYNRHRFWNKAPELSRLPSEYFYENIYMTFQDDWTAVKMVDQLNINRLLWANDFPHSDSTWPLSQQLVAQHMAHLTPQQQRLILRDNCIELFGMDVPEQIAEVA